MKYSIVIPCYKSKNTIINVINGIDSAMKQLKHTDYQIICVNDFPGDETFCLLKKLAQNNKHLITVNLSRNFGQHAALLAGYKLATGDYIISMDDDGQTDPTEIFKLVDKIEQGYDVVFAKYQIKKHSFLRNVGSKVNDLMSEIMIGKPADLYISSFFIAKSYIIKEVIKYENSYPYVTGLVLRSTSSITNAIVEHKDREDGHSNYSMAKLISLWFNGFTAFSVKPLRISMFFGVVCAFCGFLLTIYAIFNKVVNPNVPLGWTSIVAAITIIGGIILLVLGMIGEYIGRIYMSLNNAPQYIVKEIFTNNNRIE